MAGRGRARAVPVALLATAVALLTAACGAGPGRASAATEPLPTAPGVPAHGVVAAGSAPAADVATSAPAPPPPHSSPTRAARASARATPSATPAAARPSPRSSPRARAAAAAAPRCSVPSSVTAKRVLRVTHKGTRATVRACVRRAGVYRLVHGPYKGWVGYNGVAAAGAKREGDGKTPSGVFALRGGFGHGANPGLPQGWFRTDSKDVWVDDPGSALYNTHRRKPANGRWTSAENLRIPAYRYAQVIGYNEARTPGRGSAIFLHLSTGNPTAGCVSLPKAALLTVMRWETSGTVVAIS